MARILSGCIAGWRPGGLPRRGILVEMRSLVVLLVVWSFAGTAAAARPEAVIGSGFADAYAAFAPLKAIHGSFADHQFSGTPIAVPSGIGSCCDETLLALQRLQEEIVVDTGSASGEALGALVRLRLSVEAFCSTFGATLVSLGQRGAVSDDEEGDLVAESFFAEVHALEEGLTDALDAALNSTVDDESRWILGVTFVVRTLLIYPGWTRVPPDTDLAVLFYGRSDLDVPRFDVPDAVRSAMAELVAAAGRELDEEEIAVARWSAEAIYDFWIDG